MRREPYKNSGVKIKNYPLECGCMIWYCIDGEERFVERQSCSLAHMRGFS